MKGKHICWKSRKEVSVVPDLQGDPPAGFAVSEVRVVPDRVWLAGAKSHVMRVPDVKTEPIDVSEIRERSEIQARLVLTGGDTVWAEEETPVTVQIVVDPVTTPETDELLDGVSPAPAEEALEEGGSAQG